MVGFYRIGNDDSISVYEISGHQWIRRRTVLNSASEFSLLQWKDVSKPGLVAKSIVPEVAAVATEYSVIASKLSRLTVESIGLEEMVHPDVTDDAIWYELVAVKENLKVLGGLMTALHNSFEYVKDNYCETTDIQNDFMMHVVHDGSNI